jgi:hypothetical protein
MRTRCHPDWSRLGRLVNKINYLRELSVQASKLALEAFRLFSLDNAAGGKRPDSSLITILQTRIRFASVRKPSATFGRGQQG